MGSSALCAIRLLPPGRFLVLISVRCWVNPRTTVRVEEICQEKKTNDLNGNRTLDLPVCSTAPQPTTLPRTLINYEVTVKIFYFFFHFRSRIFSRKEQKAIAPLMFRVYCTFSFSNRYASVPANLYQQSHIWRCTVRLDSRLQPSVILPANMT
jgi:hypothetical protein